MDGRYPGPVDTGDSEGGFSLIEVLITVVIMGLGFVAILAGMATSATSASVHRTQAVAELEVRRYAELIQAASYSETGYTAAGVGYSPLSDPLYTFTADNADVTCIDENGTAVAACPAKVEIVNVVVRSTDGRVTEKVQIVKRNS